VSPAFISHYFTGLGLNLIRNKNSLFSTQPANPTSQINSLGSWQSVYGRNNSTEVSFLRSRMLQHSFLAKSDICLKTTIITKKAKKNK
jgi:hypothetical protein